MTAPAKERRPRRRRSRLLTIIGLCLVLAGLGVLGYGAWQYYGTNIVSKHKHSELTDQLKKDWTTTDASADIDDDAMGLVRIKRFGDDFEIPLVKGFDDGALAKGIGWYPKGVKAGKVGNFAIAGHRVTHGEPFRDFLKLRKGDKVEVETRSDVFTYELTNNGDSLTLPFSESWPLQPVPEKGHAGETPQDPKLTMVTCSELFHTDNRNIVFGDLVSKKHKTEKDSGE